jgi:protein-histidine pros-kinase
MKINLGFARFEVDAARVQRESRWLLRFNLVLLPLLVLSFLAAAFVIRQQLRTIAADQALNSARLLIQAAQATRLYTNDQIAPLLDHEEARVDSAINSVRHMLDERLPAALEKALGRLPVTKLALQGVQQQILNDVGQAPREIPAPEFFPQSISFYAATEAFNYFRSKHPDYSYKEATLNPTNPRDHAVGWEADLVNAFTKTPSRTELFGRRETPAGASFYYCAPIRVNSEQCLACHSTPDRAPPQLIKAYGTANGLGWKLNNTVGAQIVSVPASSSERAADDVLKRILERLAIIFGFLFLFLNFALYLLSPSSPLRPTAEPDDAQKSTQGLGDHKTRDG